MTMLEAGRLVKVTMEIRLPVAATEDQVESWLRHELAGLGSCAASNPLLAHDPEVFGDNFSWDDTGIIGHREEFGHVTEGSTTTSQVRYRRERAA